MKTYLFLILYLSFIATSYSQYYFHGDTLTVVSLNGLNIREAPDQNSSIRSMLKNGEKVVILKTDEQRLDSIEGFQGHWTKIHSVTSGSDGFVFDAFISHYPVLTKFEAIKDFVSGKYKWTEDEMFDFLPALLEEYALNVFKPVDCQISYSNGSDGEGAFSLDIIQLKDHVRLIKHGSSEGHGTELEFSKARFTEVYYVALNILKFVPHELSQINEEDMKQQIYFGQRCIEFANKGCIIRIIFKSENKISILFNNACC